LHPGELGICGLAGQAQHDRTAVVLKRKEGRQRMLETIAIVLIVLWLLGVVSGYTLGNFIYVLLVVAIVLFLVRLISGRRVV
jgi:low affinity Fe/Cu permease